MTDSLERPKYLTSFFAAMSERSDNGSLWRMFIWPVLCGGAGGCVAYFVPASFWSDSKWDVAATVYTGVLTLNGLILALSWSAFSRIYESISAPKFCSFLRRHGLLNKYIVTVSSIHGLQLVSILFSGAGLVVLLLDVPYLIVDRVILAFVIAFSVYAIQQASAAVGIMNDLLWQKSIFDESSESGPDPRVVPMNGKNGKP